ncbi:uncharacterized protein LOC129751570 [Uranotaenia lowii]|uniref:uncharacterized protein LOC129751570 n=1 Tax=Uranotaenia lowii TaxID=190385 RepID=UPI00247956A8|nr:uncharacterized protein LOC129751570 [Uranotaenia lowii]XP_055603142.1 uncharacterized protein LOC129751570 [Uranotaenia lowii]XP_055603150.1 uncharacterized protein LOC129751570 [Uranotaenia lowii]XP_055603158.1 uncharacterized protein LOC129751570 [Uranotaenia lowii]
MSDPAPVPVPRPRNRGGATEAKISEDKTNNNLKNDTDETDFGRAASLYPQLNKNNFPELFNSQNYENFEIPHPQRKTSVSEKISNVQQGHISEARPVPAPRRTKIVVRDDEESSSSNYQNVTPIKAKAENSTGAIKKSTAMPSADESGGSNRNDFHRPPIKHQDITMVHNDLKGHNSGSSPGVETNSKRFSFDADRLSGMDRPESDGVSIGSADSGKKYKTSSPGELFKSIGLTSKLLTESISERVSHKTKKVVTKLDKNLKNKTSAITSWKTEASSKVKNVSKSINSIAEDKFSLSLTRNKNKRSNSTGEDADFLERRQTVPAENSEIMHGIQFESPLNNKVSNRYDLTKESSSSISSTYDIPKNTKRTNFEDPPPYTESMKSGSKSNSSASLASASSSSTNPPTAAFTRNSGLSQSLYSRVIPKKERKNEGIPSPLPLRIKNKSESNLHESKFYIDSVREVDIGSSAENIPPPSFPPPILNSSELENPYGKLNIIPKKKSSSESSNEDNTLPELLKKVHIRKKAVASTSPDSRRATCSSGKRIFSRRSSSIDELRNNLNLRSDSWNYYDISSRDETQQEDEDSSSKASTPEPTYVNNEASSFDSPQIYGQICEMETKLLKPEPLNSRPARNDYDEVSISDVIDEFDPLSHPRRSLDAILEGIGDELDLIENILSSESYGRRVRLESSDEDLVPEGLPSKAPKPPKRSDSLLESSTAKQPDLGPPLKDQPEVPKRRKHRSPKHSIIVHQNASLPSDSIENLVEGLDITPYLAKVEEPTGSQDPADLSYPPSNPGPSASWFVSDVNSTASPPEPDMFLKNSKVNPVNEKSVTRPSEKIQKEIPSELAKISEDEMYLPSYNEAIAAAEGLTGPLPGPSTSSEASNNKPSVTAKLLSALKRKSSVKGRESVRNVLEMVPKPLLTERLISHQGHILKLPSGVIGDVFNELVPRSVVLKEKILQTYQDPQKTQPKETLHLKFILSLQCVLQHKFSNDGELELHCFEIVLALPKKDSSSGASQQLMTNPNLVITSSNHGNVKTIRQSYMFGVHKRSDRNIWMAKIFQSVTDVFPEGCLSEFTRGGWCYMKKSVTTDWSGAWLLLAKRRLYFYNYQDRQLEQLDLRKARFIGEREADETIRNLHVEAGSSILIDCPPYATLYFIMCSPRETQIWRKIIRDTAHKNGSGLHSQQLTKSDVPVLIDKCINFIYAHGSMSEGIYRKSGSASQVTKILQLFKEDAFSVQLVRSEFNEYDVAGALKKFIRDIPNSFFGDSAISFVSITSLKSAKDKLDSYHELLKRLPRIEYNTLKKLIGHLHFISSLEKHNKMSVPNLAMIWGSTIMANSSLNQEAEQYTYSQDEADVVADLIKLYKNLFTITPEEIKKEQLMLKVLQKYHAAAENLSDTVKHSGDFKVWVTIDCDSEAAPSTSSTANDEKLQINVTLTPTKTASDLCKELAGKTSYEWYKLTLYEVISEGALTRPVHFSERPLESVLRWTQWNDADRKNNYLALRPTTTLHDVYRQIQKELVLTPTTELMFADQSTKVARSYKLQLIGREIVVLKKLEGKKDRGQYEEHTKINLDKVQAYIGRESKRDKVRLRWAITLVDHNFKKRTRDSPFIGHLLGGVVVNDLVLWYSSILYSLHKDNILPSSDLFF